MSAARLPPWSSPNFLTTAIGTASHARACWYLSKVRTGRMKSMWAFSYPARRQTEPDAPRLRPARDGR